MVVGGVRGYLLIFRLPRIALSSVNKIAEAAVPRLASAAAARAGQRR